MKKPLSILLASTLLATSISAMAETKVGFVYVGPKSDYGYNYAQDQGRLYLEEHLEDVETLYFENIPENADVQRVMERMIRSGVEIVFPTSYGYLDHALKVAEKYPDVHFAHSGGLKTSDNLMTYFAEIDQAMYLAGIAAGMTTETNKLGFIAAHPIPQVLRNINAFTRGARSVNPEVTTSVIWTSGWSDPSKESEAAEALIDNGADVLTGHVDSPINYVQVAEERGVYSVGYHADASKFAPEGWLVGAVWNWGPMMVDIVESVEDGTWESQHLRGDLLTGAAQLSDFGSAVSDDTIAEVEERRQMIMDEEYQVWAGPITGQDGKVIVAEGDTMTLQETEKMDFLVEGVEGRLP
ncbi:BMP family ABC transporter substrate-binding protein [Marinobacter sp.]|uniref:BMP family ABC transporter substrate-binding protein n=1 Tax=Marinobacter sp. TaxID=50741 RepID=UPI00198FF015|nr:BMP family ABC transporter substrate-binding protein [Marinobacter sp.]MBC7191807.1 BMP family ABC transporter substrate-binding protein [Marinobacter sp.]